MPASIKERPSNLKGITRIDSRSTHGWFVRAYRNGKTHSRLFSDRKFSSPDAALEAAKQFRDELNDLLKTIPKAQRAERIVLTDCRNKTGELGVSRISRKGPNGTCYEAFSVSWRPAPRIQRCTSFSIRKYGEKGAFRLAVEFRRKMMKESHGENFYRKLSHRRRKSSEAAAIKHPSITE